MEKEKKDMNENIMKITMEKEKKDMNENIMKITMEKESVNVVKKGKSKRS